MIIYRPHRGGLVESMSEAREFEDALEMKHFLSRESYRLFGKPLFAVDDIVISEKTHDDPRIGWREVKLVCVKRYGNENYMELYGCAQCIGYCSENYDKWNGVLK